MTERIYLTEKEMQQYYDRLVKDELYFVDGQHSMWVPSQKVRYIDSSVCEEFPDINGEVISMTPGEIARTELERHFGKPNMIIKTKYLKYLDLPPPYFYDGREIHEYLYYCDLKGAYKQIYEPLTLDLVWPRGLGEMELEPIAKRLAFLKLARNSVVGVTRSKSITGIKGEKIIEQKFRNPYFTPHLWFHIQNVLHEIANTAINMGCHYVATDGYIFSRQRGFDNFVEWLEEYHFTYRTVSGIGYITGMGSYKVGNKQTRNVFRRTSKISNLIETRGTVKWLKKVKEAKGIL